MAHPNRHDARRQQPIAPMNRQATVMNTATQTAIRPVIRGSKWEPFTGNDCQVTLIVAWNTAAAKTLLAVLL